MVDGGGGAPYRKRGGERKRKREQEMEVIEKREREITKEKETKRIRNREISRERKAEREQQYTIDSQSRYCSMFSRSETARGKAPRRDHDSQVLSSKIVSNQPINRERIDIGTAKWAKRSGLWHREPLSLIRFWLPSSANPKHSTSYTSFRNHI